MRIILLLRRSKEKGQGGEVGRDNTREMGGVGNIWAEGPARLPLLRGQRTERSGV